MWYIYCWEIVKIVYLYKHDGIGLTFLFDVLLVSYPVCMVSFCSSKQGRGGNHESPPQKTHMISFILIFIILNSGPVIIEMYLSWYRSSPSCEVLIRKWGTHLTSLSQCISRVQEIFPGDKDFKLGYQQRKGGILIQRIFK